MGIFFVCIFTYIYVYDIPTSPSPSRGRGRLMYGRLYINVYACIHTHTYTHTHSLSLSHQTEAQTEEVKAVLRKHSGKHSLFFAVVQGVPELVAELIEEGADLNEKDAVSLDRVCFA